MPCKVDITGLTAFRNMFKASGEWYAGSDDDPLSAVFVVRDKVPETGEKPGEQAVFHCAMNALLGMFSMYEDDAEAARRLEAWTGARIRKIVKRASGSKWNKVVSYAEENHEAFPSFLCEEGGCSVLAFAPMRASEQAKPIKQLQVSGLDLGGEALSEGNDVPVVKIVLDRALDMTTGKAIAQLGHGVQLAMRNMDDEMFGKWSSHGFAMELVRGGFKSFPQAEMIASVHDAGFTEVASGSETARVFFEN